MMKNSVILFKGRSFNPNSPEAEAVYWPPLSLLSLAAPLRDAGFQVHLFDNSIPIDDSRTMIEALLDDVLYVAVSALTGFEIHDALIILDMVKRRRPDIPSIFGGWHACSLPYETLADPRVDMVCTGLGQRLAVVIAKRLQLGILHFADLPMLIVKPAWNVAPRPTDSQPVDPMDLSGISLPAYDLIDIERVRVSSLFNLRAKEARGEIIKGKIFYVTSFGCPFQCSYCSNHEVFGSKWGGYDIDKIVEQLRWLSEKGFNWIEFIDAEFTIRWRRFKALMEAIVESGINIRWASQASVKAIIQLENRGLMPLAVKAGLFSFNIGAESGSPNTLSYIRKKQTRDDVLDVARILKKYELEGSFNCLVGLPRGETLDDLLATFSLAFELKMINPQFLFPISFYTPVPGSEMFRHALEDGLRVPSSLEGWGAYETTYSVQATHLPWRNCKFERLVYLVITFFLPLSVPGDIQRGTLTHLSTHLRKHPLRFLIRLAHKLAIWRMQNLFFSLPLEYYLFKLWRLVSGYQTYTRSGSRQKN